MIASAPKCEPANGITSRRRTLGSVIGLLSPHGESIAGSFTDDATDVTPARIPRVMSMLPTNRFPQLLFVSPSAPAAAAGGRGNCGIDAPVGVDSGV